MVSVSPAVLRWARERAALDRDELAQRVSLKPARVAAWEETGEIEFSHLQRVAEKTHTPIGYLLLPHPPQETLPVADFRRVPDNGSRAPSPDLLDTIYQCQQRQTWYREFALSMGEDPLPFVGSATTKTSVEVVAAAIRRTLNLDEQPTSVEPNWEQALSALIHRIQDAGVLAMRNGVVGTNTHRPLSVAEFRGFALSDPYAPLIFVNGRDAKSAQMFTLVHELAHVWLGQSAVSDVDPAPDRPEEQFCNRVAAEVLVPRARFVARWTTRGALADRIRTLAREFKVSRRVMLLRALDAGAIARQAFDAAWAAEDAVEYDVPKKESGGDFYNTQQSRLGPRFARAVIVSALEGRTPYTEAFRLLNVRRSSTFDELARTLGVIP